MSKENLELWNKVEKTNPNYTKQANVKGNNITSIAPQFQIMNATEQFGSYGQTWGFKSLKFDYNLKELGLVSLDAIFFYPSGEFPIINSISIWRDNAQTKIDDNFAKKLETDALTKALSKLGFNADIFLGKFDDVGYVEELKNEFNPPVIINYDRQRAMINSATTIAKLKEKFLSFTPAEQIAVKKEKDIMYHKLIKQ